MRFPRIDENKVKSIRELRNQGCSCKEIVNRLNISASTVYIYLHYIRIINEYAPKDTIKKFKLKLKIIEATTPQTLETKVEEFMQSIDGLDSQRNYISGYKKYIAFIEYNEGIKETDPIDPKEIKSLSIKQNKAKMEAYLIKKALEKTKGNLTKAKEILEISHRGLLYKIHQYNLDSELEYFRKL